MHILVEGNQIRHSTYAGDLARGIRLCIERQEATNQDFNLSAATSTTVLELAKLFGARLIRNNRLPVLVISRLNMMSGKEFLM